MNRGAFLRGSSLAAICWLSAPLAWAETLVIHGAGATFPAPVYGRWAAQYQHERGVELRYEAVGSGEGRERISGGAVDFGASDVPLSELELKQAGLVQFPAVIGGVVPVVNIKGIKPGELKLTGQVLGDIYLGRIRRWDDPQVAALNPGLALPHQNITVVHRADASGTTYLWTSFLSRTHTDWQAAIGASTALNWPIGVAGVGNEGVASYVQRTRVSIGYVEYAYAKQHHLAYVAVRNRDGHFVLPDREAFAAAAGAVGNYSDLINRPGPLTWPITGASFVLLQARANAAQRSVEVLRFFDWAFKQGGQAATELDYVPMPQAAVELIGQSWRDSMRDAAGQVIWK